MGNVLEKTKNLEDIKEILDRLSVEFFLEYGTALGIYRDNDFLPDDKDIDLGIIGLDRIEEIREELIKIGFEIKSPTLMLCLRKGESIIDVHFYIEEDDRYRCFVDIGNPYFYFPKRFAKLQDIEFKGKNYKIQSPPEEYLSWVYGCWRDKTLRNSAIKDWHLRKC